MISLLKLARIAKYYISDVNRIWKNEEKIEEYRQKCFKKILKKAEKTPLYRKKYKGIDLNKVSLYNIEKLPILTKDDLRKNFPEGIIPSNFKINKAYLVSTSGSTGKPVSIYTDFYGIIKAMMGFLRELKEYEVNWRKDKLSIIADLTPRAIEEAYLKKAMLFKFNNIQILHVGEDVKKLIEKIDRFKPKFIGGYPGVLRTMAILKKRGYGKNISPDVMASSGAILDEYTKKYIEEAFEAELYDVYGSTEAGPIAFQCKKKKYHIHHDMVHVEFPNNNIVVTRLYGNATPIIRYNGLNDIVHRTNRNCSCGINSPLIEKIEGRKADVIITPRRIIAPLSITGIPLKVMDKLNCYKIEQFQIVQESFDEINIFLVIKESNEDIKKKIIKEMKKEYERKINDGVKIEVFEVDEIKSSKVIPPVVVSKVKSIYM